MLDLNADANRTNKFGMTPLHHASVAGASDIVSALIEVGGARPSATDDAGRAPIHWACGNGFVEVVKILLDKGAKRVVAMRCRSTGNRIGSENVSDHLIAGHVQPSFFKGARSVASGG